MPDKAQTDIIMGLPGPRRSAEDYLEASMMNTILGIFGMMGRIGQSVREEQGLAYYAYSRLAGGLGPGAWTAAAGVAPDNVEQAVESIRAEIRRIQDEPVDAEELADSRAYRTGSLPVSLETNGALADDINATFGSFDAMKEQFNTAGATRFGSGWAWLTVSADGKLQISSTPNQDNPLMDVAEVKGSPILGLDVWEHAYYLRYQNLRPAYMQAWWDVVNWDKVSELYSAAKA